MCTSDIIPDTEKGGIVFSFQRYYMIELIDSCKQNFYFFSSSPVFEDFEL